MYIIFISCYGFLPNHLVLFSISVRGISSGIHELLDTVLNLLVSLIPTRSLGTFVENQGFNNLPTSTVQQLHDLARYCLHAFLCISFSITISLTWNLKKTLNILKKHLLFWKKHLIFWNLYRVLSIYFNYHLCNSILLTLVNNLCVF